jgi:hypothetical protein
MKANHTRKMFCPQPVFNNTQKFHLLWTESESSVTLLIEVNAGNVASSWFGDISDVGWCLHLKAEITSGFRNEEKQDRHYVTHPTIIATLQP